MVTVDIAGMTNLFAHHLVDWQPQPAPEPQLHLLRDLTRGGRTRSGMAQSEHSKKREAFITGMDAQPASRVSRNDARARNEYLEEWNARLRDNL